MGKDGGGFGGGIGNGIGIVRGKSVGMKAWSGEGMVMGEWQWCPGSLDGVWFMVHTQNIPVLTTYGGVEVRTQYVNGVASDWWRQSWWIRRRRRRANGAEHHRRFQSPGHSRSDEHHNGDRISEDWGDAGVTDRKNPLQPKRWRVGAPQTACNSVAEVVWRLTVERGHFFEYNWHVLQLRDLQFRHCIWRLLYYRIFEREK